MSQREMGILHWAAYPGVFVALFFIHFGLISLGVGAGPSSYTAVILGAITVTFLEFAIPYDCSWRPKKSDILNDALFMMIVQMLLPPLLTLAAGLTLIRYIQTTSLTITQWWPNTWPHIGQVALMLLTAELFRYWLHVAAHNTKLWQLHAVHHSPKKLYWLNVGRFHPVEKSIQFLLDGLPFIVLGVNELVFSSYFIFYAVNGFFQHSNIDVRYGFLNYVVSSAELHRWHHSKKVKESNNNYGNNLIIWDLVFGSWFLPRDKRVGKLGLLNNDYPLDFANQMKTPFQPGLDKHGAEPIVS